MFVLKKTKKFIFVIFVILGFFTLLLNPSILAKEIVPEISEKNVSGISLEPPTKDLTVDTITNSLNEKTIYLLSKTVNDLKIKVKTEYPDSSSKKIIDESFSLLLNDGLGIEQWSEIKITRFTKRNWDNDWMKSIIINTVNNILLSATQFVYPGASSPQAFAFDVFYKNDNKTFESFVMDFINSNLNKFW